MPDLFEHRGEVCLLWGNQVLVVILYCFTFNITFKLPSIHLLLKLFVFFLELNQALGQIELLDDLGRSLAWLLSSSLPMSGCFLGGCWLPACLLRDWSNRGGCGSRALRSGLLAAGTYALSFVLGDVLRR